MANGDPSAEAAAEKAFSEFDWGASAAWQRHFDNLFPTPAASQLPKFKRKWFRSNVNEALPLEKATVSAAEAAKPTAAASGGGAPAAAAAAGGAAKRSASLHRRLREQHMVLLAGVATACLHAMPLGPLVARLFTVSTVLFAAGFAVELIRRVGVPSFTAAYMQRAVQAESAVGLFYVIALWPARSWLALAPSAILAILILCDFARGLAITDAQIKDSVSWVNRSRMQFFEWRARLILLVAVHTVLRVFLRQLSFLSAAFVLNSLRVGYSLDPFLGSLLRNLFARATAVISRRP